MKLSYRTTEEIDHWKMRDPVEMLGSRLAPNERSAIDARIEIELAEAITFARESPLPDCQSAYEFAYATGLRPRGKA